MRFAQNRYKAPVEIMSREGGFLLISTDSREWDAADCLFSGKMIAFLALFLPVKDVYTFRRQIKSPFCASYWLEVR